MGAAFYSFGVETNIKEVTNYYQSSVYNSTLSYLNKIQIEETTVIEDYQSINVAINGYFEANSVNITQDSTIALKKLRNITSENAQQFSEDLKFMVQSDIGITNTMQNPFGSTSFSGGVINNAEINNNITQLIAQNITKESIVESFKTFNDVIEHRQNIDVIFNGYVKLADALNIKQVSSVDMVASSFVTDVSSIIDVNKIIEDFETKVKVANDMKEQSSSVWTIIIVGIILLCIVGGVMYYYYGNKEDPDEMEEFEGEKIKGTKSSIDGKIKTVKDPTRNPDTIGVIGQLLEAL